MIICVSANPAIDRRLRLGRLHAGAVNRATSVCAMTGGKAAHVAMAAAALGERVTWVGFLGGSAGEECERGLVSLGIPVAVVKTAAETRMNMEIVEADGTVTEVLEPGGHVSEGEVERMLSLCRDLFTEYRGAAQVARPRQAEPRRGRGADGRAPRRRARGGRSRPSSLRGGRARGRYLARG